MRSKCVVNNYCDPCQNVVTIYRSYSFFLHVNVNYVFIYLNSFYT